MNTLKPLEILRSLANGVNPYTGKEFSEKSPYQHPQTVRALFTAIQAVERIQKFDNKKKSYPGNAGKPWDAKEEHKMTEAYTSGQSIAQIAKKHQRTPSAICARLFGLGEIE